MIQPKILVFAGSAREGSFNKKLARQAALFAEEAGAEVTFMDLRDYPVPLFDQDLEANDGEPANATAIKSLMKQADGMIIASPEHNSTYTALMKNTLDWASRKQVNEKPMECFAGKPASIISASPGALGGLRSLTTLRMLLSNLGMIVLPDQFALAGAGDAFNEHGTIKDEKKRETVRKIARTLVNTTARLGPFQSSPLAPLSMVKTHSQS